VTSAPSKPTLPAQTVPVDMPGQVRPDWYRYFKGLIPLFDYIALLQPLSDIVFPIVPDPSKSNVLRTVIDETGTSRTLETTDAGNVIMFWSDDPVTLTVPAHASVAMEAGSQIDCIQMGAGQITVVEDTGVSIVSIQDRSKSAAQGSSFVLLQSNTIDTWSLTGSLAL